MVGAKVSKMFKMYAPTTTLSLRTLKACLFAQEAPKLDDATPSYVNSHHTRTQDARRTAGRTQDARRTHAGRTQDARRTQDAHHAHRTQDAGHACTNRPFAKLSRAFVLPLPFAPLPPPPFALFAIPRIRGEKVEEGEEVGEWIGGYTFAHTHTHTHTHTHVKVNVKIKINVNTL